MAYWITVKRSWERTWGEAVTVKYSNCCYTVPMVQLRESGAVSTGIHSIWTRWAQGRVSVGHHILSTALVHHRCLCMLRLHLVKSYSISLLKQLRYVDCRGVFKQVPTHAQYWDACWTTLFTRALCHASGDGRLHASQESKSVITCYSPMHMNHYVLLLLPFPPVAVSVSTSQLEWRNGQAANRLWEVL